MNFSAEDQFAEVVDHYNFWRGIANGASGGTYDAPDGHGGRLYFRSNYSEKLKTWPEWAEFGDWGAWIIAPTSGGYFSVLSSLKHEREPRRDEDIKVMFSKFSDAGKYIIMRIGDGVRVDLRLRTQFVKWDAGGLDSHILIEPADRDAVDFMNKECPTLKKGFAEQYLKRYTLQSDPSSYGFAFPEDQPRMEVLALSFEELTTALLEDMPDSITSQVSNWRQ